LVGLLRSETAAVITYDHHGRGRSDHPAPGRAARYDKEEYIQVLTAVLDAFPEARGRKVVLFGYSMGGAIVTAYAAAYPNRVQALGLIAPAGLMDEPVDIRYKMSKLPVVGDYVFRLLVRKLGTLYPQTHTHMHKHEHLHIRTYSHTHTRVSYTQYPGHAGDEVKSTPQSDDPAATINTLAENWFKYADIKGYYPALYATLQNFTMFYNTQDFYGKVGESKIPCTCVWGTQDEVG
jgi:pimeloyl-ACP methyl ester carboxylesterase